MPRKILLYTHAMVGGGAERVMALLAAGLARRGHDVTLALDRAGDGSQDTILEQAPLTPFLLGDSHSAAVRRLAQHLAAERPDVSLSALGVSNLKHAMAAGLAGRLGRAVLGYHGHPGSEPQVLSRLGNGLTPLLTRLAARSVFVSEGLRAHYVAKLAASPSRSVVLHNPVEVDGAVAAQDLAELRARGPNLIAVGRLAPAKDFSTLLQALARLGPGIRLTILGEGSERPALEAEIARLGLSAQVALPGYQDPRAAFAAAACFVSSSRAESFGNALVEALAHGLPAVTTDCDGSREILAGGRFGALVPIGDPGALAAAIAATLADPGDPAPRVTRAKAFSVDAALDAYEALIEEVAAGPG